MKNYNELIEAIKSRINPDNLTLEKSILFEMQTISYSDVKRYVNFAMKGVESEYTQRCKYAGEKVKNHLKGELKNVAYEYQGSVMTNTHIKATSDIDLLVISKLFYSWDRSSLTVLNDPTQRRKFSDVQLERIRQVRDSQTYAGDSIEDLSKNRRLSENILNQVYSECDITGPKAIRIKNKSLNKEVDVVIASWYDNLGAIVNEQTKPFRGVQVFNKLTQSSENATYPFLSISRINKRSKDTNGRLKKMIRFLKNIKASINKQNDQLIKFSSFQFNAICYAIDPAAYRYKDVYELVSVIHAQLVMLFTNEEYRNDLRSVDGNEKIDLSSNEDLNAIVLIINEVKTIIDDLSISTRL